jgi:hypothetical protein
VLTENAVRCDSPLIESQGQAVRYVPPNRLDVGLRVTSGEENGSDSQLAEAAGRRESMMPIDHHAIVPTDEYGRPATRHLYERTHMGWVEGPTARRRPIL